MGNLHDAMNKGNQISGKELTGVSGEEQGGVVSATGKTKLWH